MPDTVDHGVDHQTQTEKQLQILRLRDDQYYVAVDASTAPTPTILPIDCAVRLRFGLKI